MAACGLACGGVVHLRLGFDIVREAFDSLADWLSVMRSLCVERQSFEVALGVTAQDSQARVWPGTHIG